jgi:hypothetical protein
VCLVHYGIRTATLFDQWRDDDKDGNGKRSGGAGPRGGTAIRVMLSCRLLELRYHTALRYVLGEFSVGFVLSKNGSFFGTMNFFLWLDY